MRNRTKTVKDTTRDYIDRQAAGLDIPSTDTPQTTPAATTDDEDWIDGLTPYTAEPPVERQPAASAAPAPTAPVAPTAPPSEASQDDPFAGLEHLDADVAREINQRVVQPRVSRLEAEVERLRQEREAEVKTRRESLRAEANRKIFAKIPKAETILASREFVDFMNKHNNPYAQETQLEILSRAYYAGDADYVISKIEDFIAANGKPRPPVGAEAQAAGGGGRSISTASDGLSPEEYRARRRKLRSTPRHARPQGAGKDLVNMFLHKQ